MNRRHFLETLALSGISLAAAPWQLWADTKSPIRFAVPTNTGISGNVVIVGGGMAGATLAKYLRLWGGVGVKVTLIEKDPAYTSNIMSNKVLTGQLALSQLNYLYDTLASQYGVRVVHTTVTGVDAANKTVSDASGPIASYDRLVIAPGIEFDLMPGMTDASEYDHAIPHAWKAGPQTQLLRNQLLELQRGARTGDVVIAIPKAPYRCPPGPYERACVIADWLYRNNVNSQVVVLDANADILVEKDNFTAAFRGDYGYVVDYRPGCSITHVNSATREVMYNDGTGADSLIAGVLNPLPPQRAAQWLASIGLYDPGANERFAPVNVLSYESTRVAGIHVIGDASQTTQPKAGHIGNQQGKTCADAILRAFQGLPPDPAPVTNSACFTPITATTATWLSAVYQYVPGDNPPLTGKMVIPAQHNGGAPISALAATPENYRDMQTWFNTLMTDSFA
jgi:sulfide dehydrogenase [flavocytochrome c] flavoprotein chain